MFINLVKCWDEEKIHMGLWYPKQYKHMKMGALMSKLQHERVL